MRRHLEKRVLPYTSEQVYALVADVGRYPEFLPWCLDAHVIRQDQNELKAVLHVGYKALHDTFTSLVTLNPPHSIKVAYAGGPLKHLENEWRFEAGPNGSCVVTFFVAFDFKSLLLGKMMDLFFDAAFCKMVSAFEQRAAQLYGNKDNHE